MRSSALFLFLIVAVCAKAGARSHGPASEHTPNVAPPTVEEPAAPAPVGAAPINDYRIADDSFLVGHNLTATSDVLEGRHCTVGLQVTACRVAPVTVLGISTWLLHDYKMATVAVRHLISTDEHGNRWAVQASYFQTWTHRATGNVDYEMQALWLQLIRTYRVRDDYRIHVNLAVNNYFDDQMPFSLRRPSFDQSPRQINLSSLHQLALGRGWFMLGEIGILDMFRMPVHTHSGFSFGEEGSWWSWHLGYTITSTVGAFFAPTERADYQQELLSQPGSNFHQALDSSKIENDYGLHPEFALQFVF